MDAEAPANKLDSVTTSLQNLHFPLQLSLLKFGLGQWLTTNTLPLWECPKHSDCMLLLNL